MSGELRRAHVHPPKRVFNKGDGNPAPQEPQAASEADSTSGTGAASRRVFRYADPASIGLKDYDYVPVYNPMPLAGTSGAASSPSKKEEN